LSHTQREIIFRIVDEKLTFSSNMIADTAIRFATLHDAESIAGMSRNYIEYGLAARWGYRQVAREIDDPNTNVVVAGEPGRVVGFGIMSYADDDAHLILLAVRRLSQRTGVGSAILLWLEAVARTAGAARIRLEARRDNAVALRFYAAHGYKGVSLKPGMYDGKVDGVRLEKLLRVVE
jgi:[ribosomal protein S18]-alanine N-acetyltransferase